MPSKQLTRYYRENRANGESCRVGFDALDSWKGAKTQVKFEALERAGYVRIVAEPDNDWQPDHDGCSCGDPRCEEREREAYKRDGAWGIVGQYRLDPESDEWETADSCWGFVGYKDVLNRHENPYIGEIEREIVDQFRAAWKDHVAGRCPVCHGTGVAK